MLLAFYQLCKYLEKNCLHLQSPICQPTFIFMWYITLLWFSLSSRLEFCLSFPFISYYLAESLQLQESWTTTIMSLFISHGSGDLLSSARWFLICFIQLVTDDNLGRNHQEHFFTYLFSNVCWLSAETPAGAVARTPTYNYFYIKCGELWKNR